MEHEAKTLREAREEAARNGVELIIDCIMDKDTPGFIDGDIFTVGTSPQKYRAIKKAHLFVRPPSNGGA
jgi:hypothetical protein